MTKRRAIIIGAGPAGLTAAAELLARTDVHPLVFEATADIGGISRTVEYRGNRMDIGGHRFFSKSDRVVEWWLKRMPLQTAPARNDLALGRGAPAREGLPSAGADPERTDRVMLLRRRLSRIYFLRKFFGYPISLSGETLANLGALRTLRIGASYLKARLSPIRPERSLEEFFVNRFGQELYRIFFRDYTEKVWGRPCREIDASWGAQRVKGLSIAKAIGHALKKTFARDSSLHQKGTETSLIERFLYPKLGPGQMWEEVARSVEAGGGEVRRNHRAVGMILRDGKIAGVRVRSQATGTEETVAGDVVLSTMPVHDLIAGMEGPVPGDVRRVARGLAYRDFITVGLILKRLRLQNHTRTPTMNGIVPDNWIYIQEREVKLGRLQIFNNWSPYLAADPATISLGLEYFCDEGDGLWAMPDDEVKGMAVRELASIGIIDEGAVLDGIVVRVPKTYPAYFGTYGEFPKVREFTDTIANLFLIGRNGMHRYNNQDHSMLTAMAAVDNIAAGIASKENLWSVNAEENYHEEK